MNIGLSDKNVQMDGQFLVVQSVHCKSNVNSAIFFAFEISNHSVSIGIEHYRIIKSAEKPFSGFLYSEVSRGSDY